MVGESHFIPSADGTVLHVKYFSAATTKATCLLIHGFGDGGYVWHDLCETLSEVCPVVTIDLRGHGESRWSASGSYEFETYVTDVETVISALRLTEFVVVGHSLGGQLAMRIAASFREAVKGVVLVDICPNPNASGMSRVSSDLADSLRVYPSQDAYKVRLMQLRPLLCEQTAKALAVHSLTQGEQGFTLKIDPALVCGDNNSRGIDTVSDWHAILNSITARTMIVRGGASAMVSAGAARQMLQSLRNGRLVTIQLAGHAVMTDNSAEFCSTVSDFILEVN